MSTLLLDNRRLLVLVLLFILVTGLSALHIIPRQEDPILTNRHATILTPFPGASAKRVESLVTEKIEEELQEMSEIKTLTSNSGNSLSVVSVELQDSITQPEPVWSRIRDRLNDVTVNFPPGVGETTFDSDRGYAFTVIVALRWQHEDEAPFGIMRRYGEHLQDTLRGIGGTALVNLYGAPKEEIVVNVNPDILASLNLSTAQVAQALSRADAKVAAGQLRHPEHNLLIEVSGELDSLSRLRQVPVTQDENGNLIRIGDIATLQRTIVNPPNTLAISENKPSVIVATRILPDHRVDQWAAQVRATLDDFKQQLPTGIEMKIIFDQSHYTEERLETLVGNLIVGVSLVVAVLFITLGWRAALIVATALPLTSLMTLAVMNAIGLPIHQMSVTGLIVALGLIVDNAIVTTDNMRVLIAKGIAPAEAVRSVIKMLWVPLLSSTMTTVLAFMPIVLLPGPAGEFVGGIGISVSIALICSYIMAMTLIPTFSALFLKLSPDQKTRWWRNGISLPFISRLFSASLALSLRHPLLSMLAATVLPVLGFVGMSTLTEQFFPPADRDQFQVEIFLPEQASLNATHTAVKKADAILQAQADVLETHWFIGNSAPSFYYNLIMNKDGSANYAQAQVQATSISSANALLNRMQTALDKALPEAQVLVKELMQGPPFNAPLEVRLFGPDLNTLHRLGEDIRRIMSNIPSVTHTQASLKSGEPRLWLKVDEDAAMLSGLRLVDVANQMQQILEGIQGGSILESTEEMPIRIRAAGENRQNVNSIAALPILGQATLANSDYPGIPLNALGELQLKPAISNIPHRDGDRINSISAFLKIGTLAETAQKEFQHHLAAADLQLPPGYHLSFGGESAERNKAVTNLMASVGMLIVLMITTVVLSLDSFRMAAIIFVVAIQAMGLGLLSLALFQYPLGFVVITGLMGLIGLAINASIIILSELREDERAMCGDVDAIHHIVLFDTSRHIISTTITTVGGFLPLILAEGGFWPPFAVAIAGGTLLTTLISFYFVPPFFLLLRRRSGKPSKIIEQKATTMTISGPVYG